MTILVARRQFPRPGSVRSDVIGFIVITLVIFIAVILYLRPFGAKEEKKETPAATSVAETKPMQAVRRQQVRDERSAMKPAPPQYAMSLEKDRQNLPGVWIFRPTTEGKGDPRPGLRLRLTVDPARLTCTPMKPNDPPPTRDSYGYEVVVYDAMRYLKLTDPAAPQAESMYVAYRLEGNTLMLEGAQPGRIARGTLVLDPEFSPELYGTWTREAAGN